MGSKWQMGVNRREILIGDSRILRLGEYVIHVRELNEQEAARHLERSGSQRNGGVGCAMACQGHCIESA